MAFDCPLKAGGELAVTYYEAGAPKCGGVKLEVTAPDKTTQTLFPKNCAAGVHHFSAFDARKQGIYKLKASAGGASKECTAAGVSFGEAQKLPEANWFAAAILPLAALLLLRRRKNNV